MRVFVAGASGALGRRLISALAAGGHLVFGMTRTPAKARSIAESGAQPVVGDALDAAGVERALVECRPETVVHQLTALAGANDLSRFDRTFAGSNRLRTEGLDILLEAARRSGARRFVAQSFCGWPYGRVGGPVKSEDDPLDPAPRRGQTETFAAIRHVETAMADLRDLKGVALRYGAFYGPDTGLFEPDMIRQLKRRAVPLIGGGGGWWSLLHIDDAASATVAAIEGDAPGVFNVVDDEPAQVREWLPALAAAVGAKPPRRLPAWIARLLAGDALVAMMTEARSGSNAKIKREFSWAPAIPSWRQGFREIAAALAARDSS